nr:MAG TPA: hypothetical protein [Caudoviricetes sp.]
MAVPFCIRTFSAAGQSSRLITGRSRVRVLEGPSVKGTVRGKFSNAGLTSACVR